jgi:hypothetical protein
VAAIFVIVSWSHCEAYKEKILMKIDNGLMWLMKYKSVSFHAVVGKDAERTWGDRG